MQLLMSLVLYAFLGQRARSTQEAPGEKLTLVLVLTSGTYGIWARSHWKGPKLSILDIW